MDKDNNEISTESLSGYSSPDEPSSFSQPTAKIEHRFKNYSGDELQSYLLDNVSRTFALTIPELPPQLAYVVSNAYLLCRIVDTVEDEPELSAQQKKEFCTRFIDVAAAGENAADFSEDLFHLLSDSTLKGEKELIALTERVIQITHSFNDEQQQAMERCIRIMAEGMAFFQQNSSPQGLKNLKEMDQYCYYVAGVVGEMLTELFCVYSPEIRKNRDELMKLAPSFGQALQMTNILKDVWEDYERSACWLPKDYFNDDLENLQNEISTPNFRNGIDELIAVTHSHQQDAMKYTLLIPPDEKGIRRFLYWGLGMSVLTTKKIHKNLDYTNGQQVKISRRSVKNTILLTNITVGSNFLLKTLFDVTRRGLPE
jgi:farnesyl-diphosphate farnesyltransferase